MAALKMSTPQKIMYTLGIVVFLLSLVGMSLILLSGTELNIQLPTLPSSDSIEITYTDAAPLDEQGNVIAGRASYDQLINQATGTSIISWQDNLVVMFPGSSIIARQNELKVVAGRVYIQSSNLNLLFNGQNIDLGELEGVFNAEEKTFTNLSGTQSIPELGSLTENHQLVSRNGILAINKLDRSLLSTPAWTEVISFLQQQELLPSTLVDITPPVVTDLTPASGTEVETEEIIINGVTEPNVTIKLNDLELIQQQDGQFRAKLTLEFGLNTYKLSITDSSHNTTEQTLEYTLVDNTSSLGGQICSTADIAEQLICEINNYRIQNQLSTVSENSALTEAAVTHTIWMADNNTVSHIGENGSTYEERCSFAGFSCTEELIAQQTGATAIEILDIWKADADDNQVLLGDFEQVGIGFSSGFATLVLN